MSQRNAPPAPPSDSSVPTVEAPAQSGSAKAAISPPTPTSAFNTAELVAEAQKQALSGDGSSGFSQPITMPNAFPGGVPGLKPRAPHALPRSSPPPAPHAPPPAPRFSPAPPPVPHSQVPVPPGLAPHGLAGPPLPPPSGLGPTGLAHTSGQYPATPAGQSGAVALRAELPREVRAATAHVVRTRAYAFVLDGRGLPIEVGSGRFAKAYLGEERWLESKTDYRRSVVIKILQKGVSDEDRMRFQIEKELLERVKGHQNIVGLHCSGEADDPEF
ncbi:MAG: protein kinase, partial [Polyangiaceae bacterium]